MSEPRIKVNKEKLLSQRVDFGEYASVIHKSGRSIKMYCYRPGSWLWSFISTLTYSTSIS